MMSLLIPDFSTFMLISFLHLTGTCFIFSIYGCLWATPGMCSATISRMKIHKSSPCSWSHPTTALQILLFPTLSVIGPHSKREILNFFSPMSHPMLSVWSTFFLGCVFHEKFTIFSPSTALQPLIITHLTGYSLLLEDPPCLQWASPAHKRGSNHNPHFFWPPGTHQPFTWFLPSSVPLFSSFLLWKAAMAPPLSTPILLTSCCLYSQTAFPSLLVFKYGNGFLFFCAG